MSDRSDRRKPTGLRAYFEVLNEIFAAQTKMLTAALPHYGERGRNDEHRVRNLLERVLPRRYSLGTGFVICSHSDVPASPQMDIVIHDQVQNPALFRELAADVFPIECVYATVEVKASISIDELRTSASAVSHIRQMAKLGKIYSHWALADNVSPNAEGIGPGMESMYPVYLAPRAYIVGYDAEAESPESFLERLATVLDDVPHVFIHGIYASKQSWFFSQKYGESTFRHFTEDGLLAFMSKLLSDLQSFPMRPMAFSRYIEADALRQEAMRQAELEERNAEVAATRSNRVRLRTRSPGRAVKGEGRGRAAGGGRAAKRRG